MIEKGRFIEPFPLTIILTSIGIVTYPGLFYELIFSNVYISFPFLMTVLLYIFKPERTQDMTLKDLKHQRILASQSDPDLSVQSTKSFRSEISHDEVRFLTYNLYLRPPLVHSNENDYKNERMIEFLDVMHNYDVIALQEVFSLGNNRPKRIIEAARAKGFLYYAKSQPPPLLSMKFIDAGLLILSRYPIIETKAHIYKEGYQIDRYAAKQLLYCKLNIHNQHVNVFTTHMQATYLDNPPEKQKLNNMARLGQIKEMAAFVKQTIGNHPDATFIMGDLNVNAMINDDDVTGSEEYRFLMDLLVSTFNTYSVSDLLKQGYQGRHPITYGDVELVNGVYIPKETVLTTKEDHGCRQCIDYMLMINKSIHNIIKDSTKVEPFNIPLGKHKFSQLSDHYGITTTLKLSL